METAADAPGPDRVVIALDELRRLQAAVDRLPERCREAFLLQQVEGLARQEIAARMGVSEDTIKTQLQIASRTLTNILFSEPPDLSRTA